MSAVDMMAAVSLMVWISILLLPWQPWRNREVLEPLAVDAEFDLRDVTVVIPARNEAEMIGATFEALQSQGKNLNIILVDDNSDDETATIAQKLALSNLTVLRGAPLKAGWTGKLWAQEQGITQVSTEWVLLLDADIVLLPGMLKSLKVKQQEESLDFVSLMAKLRFDSFWERLLMPAFVYFFKMIYPFALSNKPTSAMAAAAGGCILLRTAAVREIGGMAAIKGALIDDCTLAKAVKRRGYRTWVGLTHGVISQRHYGTLFEIWQMVARTAYTQLRYSVFLLLVCTLVMLLMYEWPLMNVISGFSLQANVASLLVMLAMFLPILRFYNLSPFWALLLPLITTLYLMMTWTSAIRYWRGEKSRWKGRTYQKEED